MRDIINATIDENHFLKCSTYSIARNGEGFTPCLSITIPDGLLDYWAYIDFKKPNGEKFKTPRIDVNEGRITYNIPSAVLDDDGKLEVQVLFQNAHGDIWKTYVKEFAVRYSINATDDIPDKQDFITEAQKLLDEAVETAKNVEERANNGEFNGAKGDKGDKGDIGARGERGLQGPQGFKGDKGDAGAIRFLPVTSLPTANIDTSAIYLLPTADSGVFDEYIYTNGSWVKISNAPVDVSIDDVYELIEEITIGAYSMDIERTLEPDGTSYKFKKIMTVFESNGQFIVNGDIYVRVYGNLKNTNLALILKPNTDNLNSETARVEHIIDSGILKCYQVSWSAFSWVSRQVYENPFICPLGKGAYLNKWRIKSSGYLPEGFKVKIYGVRA